MKPAKRVCGECKHYHEIYGCEARASGGLWGPLVDADGPTAMACVAYAIKGGGDKSPGKAIL